MHCWLQKFVSGDQDFQDEPGHDWKSYLNNEEVRADVTGQWS